MNITGALSIKLPLAKTVKYILLITGMELRELAKINQNTLLETNFILSKASISQTNRGYIAGVKLHEFISF